MIVVADASPIIALDNVSELDLLQSVYGRVWITDIVQREIAMDVPKWISVANHYDQSLFRALRNDLDPGEASSIALCKSVKESKLIIDERKRRTVAKENGIEIIGLLGVIVKAKKLGYIDDGIVIVNRLIANGFRVSNRIYAIVSERLTD